MEIIFSVFTLLYCAGLFWLMFQWRSIPVTEVGNLPATAHKLVTVVIPVRNEADNISQLLQDLATQQQIPFSKFEVLVIDDHSEDQTRQLVESFRSRCPIHVQLLSLSVPQGFVGSHKKMAIAQAVAQAQGEIIVTTDGDCRVGPYWLASLAGFFTQRQAALVAGPVTFHEKKSLFHHLQTIEFASLIGTGAACLYAGVPNMCNGANLAFSREVFNEVNGYAGTWHIPSGDDEFLMQKIFSRYPDRVHFIKSTKAVVHTHAKSRLQEFYHQRRRWAGKWNVHKKAGVMLVAMFVFTYHSLLLMVIGMVLLGHYPWTWLCIQWLSKFLLEFWLLNDILKFMKKRMLLLNFILLECIYSAYVVFFGICANFGRYTWKNRTYK